MTEKERLSNEEKQDLKGLLEDLSNSIKSKEEISGKTTDVDKKILSLSKQIDALETKSEANNLLNDVKEELATLKEYQQFKELFFKLENEVDNFKKQYLGKVKTKLSSLKQEILDKNNLPPEQLKKLANAGREKESKYIKHGIVSKLAQKGGLVGKLAMLANNAKGFFG